ncbi:unnamed protein product [Menidia menidia]|uniref:(Atlantic silverside) hypothetical protein n=1 Tax=Menidia menidia TaxID=238744 RepID=A0A8S4AAI7_9TELE|nr:unnamed protein product [Menidia menidia]
MATGAWPLSGPRPNLITLLRACPTHPAEELKVRLSRMLLEFVQHQMTNEESDKTKELAEKCCRDAEARYYSILEHFLSQKSGSQGGQDISENFWKEEFQCFLVVFGLECALSSNQLPSDFTKLLQIYKLAAYQAPLVIELMLRSGFVQPQKFDKHLITLENNILERLAWTSDSPLWKEIKANKECLPSCQEVIPQNLLEEMEPQLEPDQPKAHVGLEMSPSDSGDKIVSFSSVSTPQKKNTFGVFASKVYQLMAERLKELCSKLDISNELRSKIWTFFEHSLVQHSRLMVDRHLDQMLLLAVHHMAKVTGTKITFSNLVGSYKSQPFADTKVCEDMLMLESVVENPGKGEYQGAILTPCSPSGQEEKDDILNFHRNYIMKMQQFAKLFAQTPGGETPPLSPYPRPPLPKKTRLRHPRLSQCQKISVSPLPGNRSPITSGLCYAIGSDTSQRLDEINSMVKAGNPSTRVCRAHSFETNNEEEEGGDGPSLKRARVDGQSTFGKRLESVVSDREKARRQPRI